MTEEEMGRYFHERHVAQTTHQDEIDEEAYDDITQNGLLPGAKDPFLWLVKCRIGEEKNLVLQLMRKYIAFQSAPEPLQIKSAFAKEGIKGYIYIEAYKRPHVVTAVEGVQSIYNNQFTVGL
jgi:transcription elongation factor SPT5